MVFLTFEATPLDSNEKVAELGGAFVNCWIHTKDKEKAEIQARKEIYKAGWLAGSLNELKYVNKKYYNGKKGNLEYYEQAKMDGECYVFHTWPIGTEDDDEEHD